VTALRVFGFLVGTPMQLQSHYADALRTFAVGYRERHPRPSGWRPKPSQTQFDAYNYARRD
jgi:hypothetical protein